MMCFLAAAVTPYSATLVLASFAGTGLLVGLLYKSGLLGLLLRGIFGLAGWFVLQGYRLWDRWLSSAHWGVLAGILVGIHLFRWPIDLPAIPTAILGTIMLTAGAITVLAYMFIDNERYEVSRGYKALHSPVKGQKLAEGLAKHGDTVGYALLVTAILMCISGFSLMNLGLSQSFGRDWYAYGTHPSREQPPLLARLLGSKSSLVTDSYADFLAYTLINLAYLVDLLDVANKSGGPGIAFVRPTYWLATVLLMSFRLFFSFVLLQQLVSLVRHGRLLGESVQDLWSPYGPIQRRAADLLKQQGPDAVSVLLTSIEAAAPLTAEQRELLPLVLSEIGPAAVPMLSSSLAHPIDDVRAVAIASLGHLRAWWALQELSAAADDPSPTVRLALAVALEGITAMGPAALRKQWTLGKTSTPRRRWLRLMRRAVPKSPRGGPDPVVLCVSALRTLLRDQEREVCLHAAAALPALGAEASSAADELFDLVREGDEPLRAAAAEALGCIKGPKKETLAGLLLLLESPAAAVLVPVLRSLGGMGRDAAAAGPWIVPLTQHENEEVRAVAAECLKNVGQLDGSAAPQLVEDLSSPDDLERARAAEALGLIGHAAAGTAPALVQALSDRSDHVRARAALALGRLGPEAAVESVPALARALADSDSVVAVRAAEALGMLGEVAGAAVPELRQALMHINKEVQRHAAAAFARLGGLEPADVAALLTLLRDEDAIVRRQAVLTLGTLEQPGREVELALLGALEDPDPEVRVAAIQVLGRPSASAAAVERLIRSLRDESDPVQVAAARALGDLDRVAEPAVGPLAELLNGQPDAVRLAGAAALGQLGPLAVAAAPQLRELVEGETAELREQALRAIVQIQPPDALEVFSRAMHDPEMTVRRLASAGLMKMKELPDEALVLLPDGLRDPDPQVCANMAHVCTRLESLPPETVPLLLAHTSSPDDGLRLNALRALSCVPIAGGEPLLARLLEDSNLQIALQAAGVLLGLDPATEGLEEVLNRGLAAGVMFREQALRVLEAADPALPGLQQLLERLWERVNDAEVHEQLARLLARKSDPI